MNKKSRLSDKSLTEKSSGQIKLVKPIARGNQYYKFTVTPSSCIWKHPLWSLERLMFFVVLASGNVLVNSAQNTLNAMAEGKCSTLTGNAAWTVYLEKIDKTQPATVARQQ